MSKTDDIAFLVDEFEMPVPAAAALITDDPATADRLAEAELRRKRKENPLSEVPVPTPERADQYPAPAFESTKPVPVDNQRTGGG